MSINHLFALSLYAKYLFDPEFGPFQSLPPQSRVDLGAMVMNVYSVLPKAPVLQEPHYYIV